MIHKVVRAFNAVLFCSVVLAMGFGDCRSAAANGCISASLNNLQIDRFVCDQWKLSNPPAVVDGLQESIPYMCLIGASMSVFERSASHSNAECALSTPTILLLTMIDQVDVLTVRSSSLLSRGLRNFGIGKTLEPQFSEQTAGRFTTVRENCHTINPP
jgi:hypothetical protein